MLWDCTFSKMAICNKEKWFRWVYMAEPQVIFQISSISPGSLGAKKMGYLGIETVVEEEIPRRVLFFRCICSRCLVWLLTPLHRSPVRWVLGGQGLFHPSGSQHPHGRSLAGSETLPGSRPRSFLPATLLLMPAPTSGTSFSRSPHWGSRRLCVAGLDRLPVCSWRSQAGAVWAGQRASSKPIQTHQRCFLASRPNPSWPIHAHHCLSCTLSHPGSVLFFFFFQCSLHWVTFAAPNTPRPCCL